MKEDDNEPHRYHRGDSNIRPLPHSRAIGLLQVHRQVEWTKLKLQHASETKKEDQ